MYLFLRAFLFFRCVDSSFFFFSRVVLCLGVSIGKDNTLLVTQSESRRIARRRHEGAREGAFLKQLSEAAPPLASSRRGRRVSRTFLLSLSFCFSTARAVFSEQTTPRASQHAIGTIDPPW